MRGVRELLVTWQPRIVLIVDDRVASGCRTCRRGGTRRKPVRTGCPDPPPVLRGAAVDRDPGEPVLCHRGMSLVPANFVPVSVCAIELCPPG